MSFSDPLPTEPNYADNPHILKWWTENHDSWILERIQEDHWIWYWSISDRICDMTPPEIIERWKKEDPICGKYAWYNVLMYFAVARAKRLGYLKYIRKPERKKCPVCNKVFSEDSVPPSVVRHLLINQIDICIDCIGGNFLQGTGNNNLSKDKILSWIIDLSEEMGIIPSQNLTESLSSLTPLSTEERVLLVKLAQRKPTISRVKSLFGSWLHALIEAGILQDGTRETSRGTQSIAKDGHVCLSLGEKTIDDFLFRLGIPHEKEPSYPEGNYRADFKIDDVLIEYFGLVGNENYDEKIELKKDIVKKNKITFVCIYPEDLLSERRLKEKLRPAILKLDA